MNTRPIAASVLVPPRCQRDQQMLVLEALGPGSDNRALGVLQIPGISEQTANQRDHHIDDQVHSHRNVPRAEQPDEHALQDAPNEQHDAVEQERGAIHLAIGEPKRGQEKGRPVHSHFGMGIVQPRRPLAHVVVGVATDEGPQLDLFGRHRRVEVVERIRHGRAVRVVGLVELGDVSHGSRSSCGWMEGESNVGPHRRGSATKWSPTCSPNRGPKSLLW